MSVDSILKKEGISVVRKLNMLEINRIAKNITDKIDSHFSGYLLDYGDLFSKLSRIDMYLAKMPTDSSCAKYLYTNNSIYFNEANKLSVTGNSIFAIHECLHFVQTQKNEHGKVIKLGLYDLANSGLGLNEAAVQYMASVIQEATESKEKYYDININTISPDYYPLQCALLAEMIYFTQPYPLYQSTLNSDDTFKNTFISCSNKKAYEKIVTNLDTIVYLEDELYSYTVKLANTDKIKDYKSLDKNIQRKKEEIKSVFFDTQNAIIESCFTNLYSKIATLTDIEEYKSKLENFKDVLCYTDNYDFYDTYCYNALYALDSVKQKIEENIAMQEYIDANVGLALVDNSNGIFKFFRKLAQKIKKVFSFNRKNNVEVNN